MRKGRSYMLKIGDNVLYGASGVMTITDIREETVGDTLRSYYVLRPTLSRLESLTFVPTDNERLVSYMRPLMNGEELLALLRSADKVEPLDWIPENRARQEYFKRVMESGDRRNIIAMINTIDECGRRREAEGKKNFISDENLRHKAIKLLYSELAVTLGVAEETVPTLVRGEDN